MSNKTVSNKSTGGRFPKGVSGNPAGRPPGSRNKTTLAIEALLEGEGESIARKLIELAQKGDLQAVRMCLDRTAPPRKERCIELPTRPVKKPQDLPLTHQDILMEVAEGRMTPGEGETLSNIVSNHLLTLEAMSQPERIEKLEAAVSVLMEAVRTLNRPVQRHYEAKTRIEVAFVDAKQPEVGNPPKGGPTKLTVPTDEVPKDEVPPLQPAADQAIQSPQPPQASREQDITPLSLPDNNQARSKPEPVKPVQHPPHRGIPEWMRADPFAPRPER
jgi:hypothetical protein